MAAGTIRRGRGIPARVRGLPSFVLWGPGEEGLAGAVVEASGGAARVAPPTGLADLLALSRAAALMVSGDTGPLHIAAAAGTPTVSLFGPTDPASQRAVARGRCGGVAVRRVRLPLRAPVPEAGRGASGRVAVR